MSKAAVLGGGGPVGIAWQAGLIVGLAQLGVDLGKADLVVGTSAGSVVGLLLASGGDLTAVSTMLSDGPSPPGEAAPAIESSVANADRALLDGAGAAAVADLAQDPARAAKARSALGAAALNAPTIPTSEWLARFDLFAGIEWPASYRCCSVDAEDGTFRVWGPSDGVAAHLAVAASCAVPLLYPPVRLADRYWIDGGVRDMLNADVAVGSRVAVVVSCTLLELPWQLPIPFLEALLAATRQRVGALTAQARSVVTVVPGAEMLQVSEWGLALMDFGRTEAAYQAGLNQATAEAERLRPDWT